MMTTIVDYGLHTKIEDLYRKNHVPISLITHGHGAANSEIYDILGFGESKKALVLSILPETTAEQVFTILQHEMNFNKPGTGITFTVPISSISQILSKLCIMSTDITNKESEGIPMTQNHPYDLIITIVNNGYFSEVMEVAKEAGATGGTLVHARGMESEETSKFLGITLQAEKDLVLILAPNEKKHKIMESITNSFGLSTEGKGICFSLPVNAALGLGTHAV